MRRLILFLICIVLFIIDNTCMPYFAIKGCYPSLLTVFIICYSINNDKWSAMWIAVFAGLLQDLYFTSIVGISPLLNMIVCIIAAIIGENIFREKIFIPVLSVFILSCVKGVLLFALLYIVGYNTRLDAALFTAIYNTVIAIIIYRREYKLLQKPYMKREWNFRKE